MERYKKDIREFLNTKRYIIFVILIAILSYGYAAMNITVGIDDLEGDRYSGSGHEMLASGRFGMFLWSRMIGFGVKEVQNSCVLDILAIVFLITAAIHFCILFKRVSGNRIQRWAYVVFSGILISYPLMNEIWEYTATNLYVCAGFLFVALSLLAIYSRTSFRKAWMSYALATVMLLIVCSSYESLAAVYVFGVFVILAIRTYYEEKKETFKSLVLEGLPYVIPLVIGVVLRVVIHRVILLVLNLESTINGETAIMWGKESVFSTVGHIVAGTLHGSFVKAFIYFPIAEFVISMIVFVILGIRLCVKTKKHILILPGIGMLASLFLLALLQGSPSPYRTCQVYALFVAFTVLMCVNGVAASKKLQIGIKRCVICAGALLCMYQSIYLNYFLVLNHQRYEEEKEVICNIGRDLKMLDSEKPVVFVGEYALSDYVFENSAISEDTVRCKIYKSIVQKCFKSIDVTDRKYRKLPETNVNSMLNWGTKAFRQDSMKKLFHYFGYDYLKADYDLYYDEACVYVEENEVLGYSEGGYIIDAGDYLIVNLESYK